MNNRPQLRHLSLVTTVAVGAALLITNPAYGQADTTTDVMVSVPWLTLLVGSLIPLLVGFILASDAAAAVKATVNLAASAVVAGLSTVIDSGGVFVALDFVNAFVAVYVVNQASHFGLWRPSGVTRTLGQAGPQIGRAA